MNERNFYCKRKWVVAPGRKEQNNKRTKNCGSVVGFLVFFFFFFSPSSEVVFFTFYHQDIAIIANFGVQTKRPL